MSSLKALLFDFGGTLDADGTAWLGRMRALYRKAGLPWEGEAFERAFYDADDRLSERHRLEGLDLLGVVRLQVRDTLRNLGAPADQADRVAVPFVQASRERLAASRRALEALRGRYRLGVVSNNYGNLAGLLDAEGFEGVFETVADSGTVGATKPDPRLFRAALEPMGLAPAEALMVGDSLARDMKGAEGLGMPHAWIAREGEPCCGEAWVLRSVTELPDRLGLDVFSNEKELTG